MLIPKDYTEIMTGKGRFSSSETEYTEMIIKKCSISLTGSIGYSILKSMTCHSVFQSTVLKGPIKLQRMSTEDTTSTKVKC